MMTMKERLQLNILVIDTSSGLCSVGIKYNEKRIFKTVDEGRTHSETLLPLIDEVLKNNEIDLDEINILGVVKGPGSFTGIRIGISSIKAISLAKNISVVEITSTESLARNVVDDSDIKIGIIDARNDQIYAGIYDNEYKLIKEFAGSINDFISILNELDEIKKSEKIDFKISFSGSGIKYSELITKEIKKENLLLEFLINENQDIEKILEGIEEKIKDEENLKDGRLITPNYLKPSNAERNQNKK